MIFLRKFNEHSSYETELSGGGVDISLPNVSYCEDVKDVHYTPYNLVRFYVGEITGTTPQTVKIYTDSNTSVDIQVSEDNKWYSYLLPKDKGLCKIEGGSVKKVVVKADISYGVGEIITPLSTVEASFKGSNTSNVTNMGSMFAYCSNLTSLDVSNFDTSNVTNMAQMFDSCDKLTSLDLSGWNTSNVTDMDSMFFGCEALTSLDVSSFDTSKVINIGNMFGDCSGLTSLDLSGWNTSNVTDINNMIGLFDGCSRLKLLDLSGWVINDSIYMNGMFGNCTSLEKIIMVGCSEGTIGKINSVKPSTATIVTE